jgi:RNA polymerase sigma-70 factor (ECF subfamily)
MERTTHDAVAEERALMRRVAEQRDESAMELLYDRFARLLYSVILAVVRDADEAQDLLQEVFVQIWNNAQSFDPQRGTAYAWIVALTRNRAIDRLRSKSFRERRNDTDSLDIVEEFATQEATPLDATVVTERAQIVRSALSELPREQRELLEMAYFQGYTQSELAEELQIPLGTVKTRMRQGLQKLHTLITGRIEHE